MFLRDRFRIAAVLVLFVCCAVAGCGSRSGNRISGKVTFKGAPVPAGKIYFMPDGSKGNTGPTGYADIKNGEYDTSSGGGQGVGRGPMIVAIEGVDPSAGADKSSGEAGVKPLFARYETKADAPESGKFDIEVPATAGNPPAKKKVNYTDP